MIQVLRNTRTGAVGWRLTDSGGVFSGGRVRVDGGDWELEDEVDDPVDAEAVDVADLGELITAWEAKTQRVAASAAEAGAFVAGLRGAPLNRIERWGGKQFMRDGSGRVCFVFKKQGGSRYWLLPVNDEEAVGIIRKTHTVKYTIGTNRAWVEKR